MKIYSMTVLCILMFVSSVLLKAETPKTFVVKEISNYCLIEAVPGSGFKNDACTEESYPLVNPGDPNMRFKFDPGEKQTNQSTFGIHEVNADGSLSVVNTFFAEVSSSLNGDKSFFDVATGEMYIHTSDTSLGYAIYNSSDNSITTSKDGYLSTSGVIFKDISIDNLIREEADGSIHIGENSLVTVEQDGKQQLYATDANGDQIDINIIKGSDLLVDGKSVSQAIADVATNTTNIATNTTGIETNTQGLTSMGARVEGLTQLVDTYDGRITNLQTLTELMQNEYRSGIAASIALSQIQYAASGFSIGVGHGEFKNKDEMAVGIGYGGQFNDDVGYQFQFGSSGDSTGFGFTVRF